ncbi:hypothetical protein CDV31_004477 [Fusarium ambrosium]|uniref:Protein RTA1 n=1 Tax=Fusarium ambrosium TaxID=131363 RepID=A0A428UQZ7_9HYPO|nr:hypothetical protein CDV31_004477 [Fusarium ambrosium]
MAASAAGGDVFLLYRYDPSMGAAAIFIVLFIAITGLHVYQFVMAKTWFFAWFVVGGFMQIIGYIGKAISSSESPNWIVKPYIIQTLLLLISPAMFAASIYMTFGRIILVTDGEVCSPLRRVWLTKIFVLRDVLSFVLQGGGIMASGGLEALHNGEHTMIISLVIQLAFFSLFSITASIFHARFAAGLIMIRSVFRLIEYAQGNAGYLISHEAYLYIFDSVLRFLTMVLFAWEHPSQLNAKSLGGGTAVRRGIRLYWKK